MVIPTWVGVGGFMHFKRLDALSEAKGVLAVAYRFTDGEDAWTRRLNRFKAGRRRALRGAKAVLAGGLQQLKFKRDPIALCVAISSGDTRARKGTHLYELGKHIAENLCWEWRPDLLTKGRHRPLHSLHSAAERDAEVAGKYSSGTTDAELVMVLDDLCTRGTTISWAAKAIRTANGKRLPVYGVVLGKTERLAYAREWGEELDNSHVPEEWGELWDNA